MVVNVPEYVLRTSTVNSSNQNITMHPKLFVGLALVATAAVVLITSGPVGCGTAGGGTNTVLTAAEVTGIQIAATLGTQVAISKDPSVTNYLALGSQAVLALVATNGYSPAALTAALNSANAGGATSGVNAVLITDAVSLYSSLFAQKVNGTIDPAGVAKPALLAIATGIQQGLAAGPIAVPK